MIGAEYVRTRMQVAASLLRRTKVSSVIHLALSYWTEDGRKTHVVECLNRESRVAAIARLNSPLDVPTYAEFVEAIMVRRKV